MQNINWENAAMTSEIDKLKEEINKLKSAVNNSEEEPLEEKEFEHPNVIPTSGAEAKEVETFINDEMGPIFELYYTRIRKYFGNRVLCIHVRCSDMM